jgi:hypothetical protein
MGLLEYQAIPSLRDVAHFGGLCAFSDKPAAAAAGFARSSLAGQAALTVHHVQNQTLLGPLYSSQPGGPPCRTSPLAFGLITRYFAREGVEGTG